MSFEEYCVLRRCPSLPHLKEVRRKYNDLVKEHGQEMVHSCLKSLGGHEGCWLAIFLRGKSVRFISKDASRSRLFVKKRLLEAMVDLVGLLERHLEPEGKAESLAPA